MPDFKTIFRSIIDKNKNNPIWDSGDYIEIKKISNTNVGAVGQEFIECICGELKMLFETPVNLKSKKTARSPWDIKIGNITFELKTATEDTGGKFQFNHIRYHRKYEAVLCLGVSPNNLYFNLWSKADISTGKAGNLVSMEKGANASYKLTKSKKDLYTIESFEEKIKEFVTNFS